jgi:hypothetical protein
MQSLHDYLLIFWFCCAGNGPCTCQASALPLSDLPSPPPSSLKEVSPSTEAQCSLSYSPFFLSSPSSSSLCSCFTVQRLLTQMGMLQTGSESMSPVLTLAPWVIPWLGKKPKTLPEAGSVTLDNFSRY